MVTNYEVGIDDVELFAGCTAAELRKIRSLMTYLEVPQDQVLLREGNLANEFVIVKRGTVRVTCETYDGVVEVAEARSGDDLGAPALLSGSRWSMTATAATAVAVLVSSASEFRSIVHIAPSVADKILQNSTARVADLAVAA